MKAKALVAVLALCAMGARAERSPWPDLSRPARAVGGGERDAAVVVGIEKYLAAPGIPGARANADEWYEYLTTTRGVPVKNVSLLVDGDAAREDILAAARGAARRVGRGGTLWVVFIGHGARSEDGKDGLLVGADAQPTPRSLEARSVRREELLRALGGGRERAILAVLDACFSGRGEDGRMLVAGLQPLVVAAAPPALDARAAVLTAAEGDQFSGPLPGTRRPAFSYLILGGLRGWAADRRGYVDARRLWLYARDALAATVRGRDQTPELLGAGEAAVWRSPREEAPNLAAIAEATAGSAGEAAGSAAVGDGVQLDFKDGSSLSGVLFKLTDSEAGIESAGMRTTWPRDGIARIVVHRTSQQTLKRMIARAGGDRDKLLAAADYAREHRLYTEYDHLRARLGLPPDPASLPMSEAASRGPRIVYVRSHSERDRRENDRESDSGDDASAPPAAPTVPQLGFPTQAEFSDGGGIGDGGMGGGFIYGAPGFLPRPPRTPPVPNGRVGTPALEFQNSLQRLIDRNAP
ncbi:MAG: hypothetical protein HKL90_08355 [Elusimicrobia bacterium]|nr:hypothetical protein [Elusimicrobiota bacterium]